MLDQKNSSYRHYLSVFTPKQPQQEVMQGESSHIIKSKFSTTKTYNETLGTSTLLCIDSRRKYKYNEE